MHSLIGVDAGDMHGLSYSCSASLTLMGAYYFVQPLSDEMALRAGIAATPLVTVAGLCLIIVCNPLYALLVSWSPLSSVQPVLHRFLSSCLVIFAFQFAVFRNSLEAQQPLALSFSFTVFLGAFAPFLMSTFWVRMAHLHTQREAHRVYGAIAAAAQFGELISSIAASALFSRIGENILIISALSVECSVQIIQMRADIHAATSDSVRAAAPSAAPALGATASSGTPPSAAVPAAQRPRLSFRDAFSSVPLLASTPLLRIVTIHTLLLSFLVSGVWYERADVTVIAFPDSDGRVSFFSSLNAVVGGVTLLIQLLLFSRVTSSRYIGPTGTLLAEPALLATGLLATLLSPHWPRIGLAPPAELAAVAYMDCSRTRSQPASTDCHLPAHLCLLRSLQVCVPNRNTKTPLLKPPQVRSHTMLLQSPQRNPSMHRCPPTSSTAPNRCWIRSSTAADVRPLLATTTANAPATVRVYAHLQCTLASRPARSSAWRRLLCAVPQAECGSPAPPRLPAARDGCMGSRRTENGTLVLATVG